MIKKGSMWACVALIFAMLFVTSGVIASARFVSCGNSATYVLEEDGTLVVSGTGDMDNFVSPNNVPWHKTRDSIKRVVIEEGITSIGAYAFYNCTELQSVTLPESLTFIGRDSFLGCEAIEDVYLSNLSAWCAVELYGVDSNPLNYTDNLYLNNEKTEELYISGDVKSVGKFAFYNLDSVSSVTFANGVMSIEDYAFCECDNLAYVMFGNTVEQIGAYAFAECDSIEELNVTDGVIEIERNAFYNCDLLKSATISDGVQSIGNAAFERCASLSEVILGENVQTIGDFAFCNCDALQNIVLPESVVRIGKSAFRFCDALKVIDIPVSVTEIESCAFGSCEALETIEVHEENSAYCSENGVLFNKDKTKLIKCPQSKAGECYEIPETVVAIEVSAFSGCDSLKNIIIPESVTQICSFAFEFCTALTDITIGENVKSLGQFIFLGCNALTNITVDENNFYYCSEQGVLFNKEKSELIKYPSMKCDKVFELPVTVIKIAEDAFCGCDALETIYCRQTAEEWKQMAEKSKLSDNVQIVYVPHFMLEIEKEENDIWVTAYPKNLSTEADTFVETLDADGKVLEIKCVTVGEPMRFNAEDVKKVKAFAFDVHFKPAIECVCEKLE